MTEHKSPLEIELRVEPSPHGDGLVGRYTNIGRAPMALTFWWNRALRVVDASGAVVPPGPGPELPCGVGEDWTVLLPNESHERPESLGCTQPAGRTEKIGWSYDHVPAGTYQVTLLYRAPRMDGFTQSGPHKDAFAGAVQSNTVSLAIAPPPKKRGLFARVFG